MILHEYVGQIVDERYTLKECVGSGATGVVFRAHQQIVDREVALKLLKRDATDDEGYRARFEREARVLGRLDHGAFVRVFDFGWYQELNQPYLVTEFIDGQPLTDLMFTLTARDFLVVIARVTDALAHAHENQVAHRDVKPDNIVVPHAEGATGAKVVDFGLASILDGAGIRVTQKGDAFGTPAYMSPEQCTGSENIGPPTDVYALACVMFEYFEGRLPYYASTASRVMIKHVTRPVPRLGDPALPEELVAAVEQAMAKKADERPTMSELGARLRDACDAGGPWLEHRRDRQEDGTQVDVEAIKSTSSVAVVAAASIEHSDTRTTVNSTVPSANPADEDAAALDFQWPVDSTDFADSASFKRSWAAPLAFLGLTVFALLIIWQVAEEPVEAQGVAVERVTEVSEVAVLNEPAEVPEFVKPHQVGDAIYAARAAVAEAELTPPQSEVVPQKPAKRKVRADGAAERQPPVAQTTRLEPPAQEVPEVTKQPAEPSEAAEAAEKPERRGATLRY